MTRHSWARQAERGLLGLFVLGLLWLPFPLASNRPWASALFASVVWVMLSLTWLVRTVAPPAAADAPFRKSPGGAVVLTLLVLFGALVAFQLSPHGFSEDRFETRNYLLRTVGYVGAFALIQALVTTDRRRMLLLSGLVGAGIVQTMVAVVLFSAASSYQLLGLDFVQGFRATGTFPNADALSNYLVLSLSAGLAVMLAQMGHANALPPRNWQARLAGAMEFMMSGKMLVRIMLIMMVIALVLTRSRMGNGVFFFALFLVAFWVMLRSRQLRKSAAVLVVSLLVVDLIIVGQWVGLSKVVDRISATEISAQQAQTAAAPDSLSAPRQLAAREESLSERTRPTRDALPMVKERPWTGFGGGAFYTVFPRYKVESSQGPYNHAHNDYVEIAADVGLPGLGLLGLVMLLSLGRAFSLMSDQHSMHVRGVAAGMGMGLICALLHATVDLNLQIYANAMTLTVLLAVVWSVPVQRQTSSSRSR